MEDTTGRPSGTLALLCPTCGAKYTLPKYVEGERYGCKRCSASLMFGKFALQQELGRGGFGVVYKAFQADLERIVALKFLHTDSEESTERFMREARIAANLSHPNITAIYEVGQHEGKPYITMQFVDGITTNKADFSVREAVFVVRDAAIAVDYAHARNVIHRDIKPHNIMVTQERSGTSPTETARRTFVMDFGLARSASKGGTLTTEGQVMGTPAFMSPEQAEGKPCDLRSDVYSLGATLYSLVAKRPPFDAATPLQVLMAVTQEDPPPPSSHNPEIDKGLEAIILKAMAKDPADRYPTASRLAQDLTSWLAGGVTDAGPTVRMAIGTARSIQARKKRQRTMVMVGIVLILAGGLGLVWQLLPRRADPPVAAAPGPVATPPAPATRTPPVASPVPAADLPSAVLLEVVTDPRDATIRLDNRERGKSPLTLNDTQISPGTYEVVVTKSGYQIIREKVTVTAGPKPVTLQFKLEPEVRQVAFTVDSDPSGAKILLNGTDTGETTPHVVHVDEVDGGVAQVQLILDGYLPVRSSFDLKGETRRISLMKKVGRFLLTGALPGSTVHLFAVPGEIKNLRSALGLWSENPDSLPQALASLDPADVPWVVDRVRAIAAMPELALRARASKYLSTPRAAHPLEPEKSVPADDRGMARLENAWILNRYRIFVTSPRTLDFVSTELVPQDKEELSVTAETTVVVTVGAKSLRPAVGRFRVWHSASSQPLELVPGGAPVRVAAGPVSLEYQPPAGDPILRPFTLSPTLKESYDVSGNLYEKCAAAYVRDRNIPLAMRAYTKVLEETQYPSSEQAERSRLPELARGYYRKWIDAALEQGKLLGGDPAQAIDAARKKPAAEAAGLLLEIYAAKDTPGPVRGVAASALAALHAKLREPYEAMEWCERSVREKVDPGQETAVAVVSATKGLPGLDERWSQLSAQIDELRKLVQAKTESPAPPPAAVEGKVGVISGTKFGIFVKLDPNVELARGDILEVYRDSALVGEIVVQKQHGAESAYPNGSAECRRGQGAIQKGDEVRRKK